MHFDQEINEQYTDEDDDTDKDKFESTQKLKLEEQFDDFGQTQALEFRKLADINTPSH